MSLKKLIFKLDETTIGLDNALGKINYISHAHSDHLYYSKNAKIYCSKITSQLGGIPKERQIQLLKNVELYNSGHIFGATQIKLTTSQGEIVYTSDFKLRDGLTTKAAKILKADYLIIDGTYGAYDIKFEPKEEIYEKLRKVFLENKEHNQIWGAYRVGKAQELIKFLNEYLDVCPIVSSKIAQVCKVYESNGIKLDYAVAGTQEAYELVRGQFCAVYEIKQINKNFIANLINAHRKKAIAIIARGWAKVYKTKEYLQVPLSDHADFSEILEYSIQSQAKKVFVAYGENDKTAAKLRMNNIDAYPIEQIDKHLKLEDE